MTPAERAAFVLLFVALLGSGCAGRSEQHFGGAGGAAASGVGGTDDVAGGASGRGATDDGGVATAGRGAGASGTAGATDAGGSGVSGNAGAAAGNAGTGGAALSGAAGMAGAGGNSGVAGMAGDTGQGGGGDVSCNCDYPDVAYCSGSIEAICNVVPMGGCAPTLDELITALLASCPPGAAITYELCEGQPVVRFAATPPETYLMTFDPVSGVLVGAQAIGRISNTCGDSSRLTTFQAGNPAYRSCETHCSFCPTVSGEGGQPGEIGEGGAPSEPPACGG